MLAPSLIEWFCRHARDLPWRRTRDPYAIWISEIMLQQTQVKTVIPYWERWLRALPDVAALAAAPEDQVLKLWEGLGYYRRARNLRQAARVIVEQHDGKFPAQFDALLALPGVGRYTAGAVGSIAFNQPVPILDGNVIRVLTRVFGIGEDPRQRRTNERLWSLAARFVEWAASGSAGVTLHASRFTTGPCSALNQALMELGATVCTPRDPHCDDCPVRSRCGARRENRVAELPNPSVRAATTVRRFAAFVIEHAGRYLVRRRPMSVVNAGLWEFPNIELRDGEAAAAAGPQTAGRTLAAVRPLTTVRHSITRYRITVEAFLARASSYGCPLAAEAWLTPAEFDRLAFTSAHRRIAAAIGRQEE